MKSLFFALLFVSVSLQAQNITKGSILKEVSINGRPSFFFKVHGSGNFISFTLALDPKRPAASGKNMLLNVANGSTMQLPGPWDPVFITNTSLMVIPRGDSKNIVYELHDLDKLLGRTSDSLLGEISNVTGLYQSVGVLSFKNGKMISRLIAEDGYQEHSVQDFTYDSDAKNIELADKAPHKICPEFLIKLPMLSKDARYLSGVDLKTKKSSIWKINPNYTCTKFKELSLKTGKLNFNKDSTKVTYHLYNEPNKPSDDRSDNYVPTPDNSFVSDIFVLDLKSNKTTRITSNIDTNSMYPDFTTDGRLVFINHPHSQTKKVTFIFLNIQGI